MGYCMVNDILVEEQNGFRPKRSCAEHLYSFTSVIRKQFHNNKDVFAVFINMKKAFDYVNRDLLRYRLLEME